MFVPLLKENVEKAAEEKAGRMEKDVVKYY